MKIDRKRNVASLQYRDCFTIEELADYRSGRLPREKRMLVYNHLKVGACPRCIDLFLSLPPEIAPESFQEIPELPEEKQKKIQSSFSQLKRTPSPLYQGELKKGQIWTTKATGRDSRRLEVASVGVSGPVYIYDSGDGSESLENLIRVFPISWDTEYLRKSESFLVSEKSPLNCPFIIEVFAESPMLAGNLLEFRGSLSAKQIGQLENLRAKFLSEKSGKFDRDYLAWRERELEASGFFSAPVNASMSYLEAAREDNGEVEFQAQPFKYAAKSLNIIELSDDSYRDLDIIVEDGEIWVTQENRDVFLRVRSDGMPENLVINKRPASFKKFGQSWYKACLGSLDDMTVSNAISFSAKGQQVEILIKILKKE